MMEFHPSTMRDGAAIAIALFLIAETIVSVVNERWLRARGAVEADDDVWTALSLIYPLSFVAMYAEGMARGGPSQDFFVIGSAIWIVAKALKSWAILSLGRRWCFRVLVLPGVSLIQHGPYRWFRHPNYIAIAGELAGATCLLGAPIAGIVSALVLFPVLQRRIRVEERTLAEGLAVRERGPDV